MMNGSPARGDVVERWLERHREDCKLEFERATRNAIDRLLKDYRAHADAGIALDEEGAGR
jgi:hypothetical protein